MTSVPNQSAGPRVQFGDFTLDVRDHTLRHAGQPVHLRPKTFETLVFLVEQRGRLVSKDEILSQVWAGVVVTDGSLTHCIEEIRHALDDDPHHPRFVQTVPRVGYRFIAEVRQVQQEKFEEELLEEEEYTAFRVKFREGEEPGAEKNVARMQNHRFLRGHAKPATIVAGVSTLLLLIALAVIVFLQSTRRYPISSVAVLPFENLSRDPDQDYFADGLTDALIAELARASELRVISRNSIMQYKQTRKPASQIAEELQVDGIIEGSVLRSGHQVRITAALIGAGGERRLWGETCEGDQRDMVTLLRVLARSLAREIPIDLATDTRTAPSADVSVDPAVYELYLKGRFHWNKRTAEGFRKGIECFESAIALDPYCAPAYAGLADSYNMLGDYDLLPPKRAFPKARAAALQALALDGSLADAHASLAYSAMRFDWDWPEVEEEYGRAIGLNPNSSNAHHWFGLYLAMRGRFAEAKDEMRKAHALDPLALIVTANVAWVHYFERDYDQAIRVCGTALDLDSNFISAHVKLGWAYEQKRMYPDAVKQFRNAVNSQPNDPSLLLFLARAYAMAGKRNEAVTLIRQATEQPQGAYVSGYHVAAAYVALGETARALDWLTRAYGERSGWLAWLNVDPKFDNVRNEPQFGALLDSLNLR